MSAIPHITGEQFGREVLQSELPVVVDFYAPWCGPCRMLAPVLEALADEFAGRVKFVKVDIDRQHHLASQCHIQGVPTLLLVAGGDLVDAVVGLAPPAAIRDKIEQLAANPVGVHAS